MENGNGNGNLREKIKKLNLYYLNIVQEIGAMSKPPGLAQTALGLDDDRLKLLMSLDTVAKIKMADSGAILFRLKVPDLTSFQSLYKKGNDDQTTGLVAAALAADDGREGEA